MSRIAFIGAGKIAQAFIQGLRDSSWELIAFDPQPEMLKIAEKLGAKTAKSNIDAVSKAETVIICTKPDKVQGALIEISKHLENRLVISVAAGTTIDQIEAVLKENTPIIRAMPNTPALIRSGITGLFARKEVSELQKNLAEKIMASIGKTIWVTSEQELNIVTALSGSGPAYFFLLMEYMIEAGREEGLDQEVVEKLVIQTALGASKMADLGLETPKKLKENVTSPGGTTEAALNSYKEDNFKEAVKKAVRLAKLKSIELSES
ncbi:MAG: pyrroline-5-carboxylate reductase [Gammaproteobacteria bacterium]|nr:pyrroline-5-carboxylate reductase [Gammaproteobacteria bacterium]